MTTRVHSEVRRRTAVAAVRLTEAELAELQAAAAEDAVSVGSYIRGLILRDGVRRYRQSLDIKCAGTHGRSA
jgi:hypothetical protein